jgi:hypothetical protein
LADEGNTVMVATTYLNEWADTLGFDFRWNNSFILSEVAGNNLEKDTLKWVSDMPKDSVYAQVPLWQSVYPQMIERTLLLPDSVPHDNLLIYNGTREGDSVCEPVAVSFSIGSGELILVSSPLLLTNYMTLDGNGSALQGRLMNRLKANPIIRTEAYMSVTAQEESSPFYVLLREPPLRWALYLTFLGILLFCVFTARRRQRVIPVKKPLKNGQLEFVKQIGNLYYRNRATDSIIVKKHKFLTHKLRQTLHVDITEKGELEENSKKISAYTGLSSDEVKRIISSIYDYFDQRAEEEKNIIDDIKKKRGEDIDERTLELWVVERMSRTDDKRMMTMIDDMNKIERLVGE